MKNHTPDEVADLMEALEDFWNARRALYEEGESGISKAKENLYKACSEVFGPIDPAALGARGRHV